MQDRYLHANLRKQLCNGLTGFAVLFIPVMLHMNDPTNPTMTLWTLAYIALTLALGGIGLFFRGLADTLLSKLAHENPPHAKGR